MDEPFGDDGKTLRDVALKAIGDTQFYPASGQNRLDAMIEVALTGWCRVSAPGGADHSVVEKKTGEILADKTVQDRIAAAISEEGADAWFASDASRFLETITMPMITSRFSIFWTYGLISGSTHSFVLEERDDLQWPASLYLEGSDQHRGWFHSKSR